MHLMPVKARTSCRLPRLRRGAERAGYNHGAVAPLIELIGSDLHHFPTFLPILGGMGVGTTNCIEFLVSHLPFNCICVPSH